MLDKNGERMLAYTVTVDSITPIEKADNIELAHVGGWNVIIRKHEFNAGDMAVFFEIDSLLPETEWSEFLRPKKFKVKTYKLGKFNVVSQGLLLPMSILPDNKDYAIHEDVTKVLGVKYYVAEDNDRKAKSNPNAKYNNMCARNTKLAKKKWWKWLMKRAWGRKLLFVFFGRKKDNPKNYPVWIKKTDEDRCLIGNTKIATDHGVLRIADIVNKKLDVKVKSYNINTGEIEYKPINSYQKYDNNEELIEVEYPYRGNSFRKNRIICTMDHKFFTNGKYIEAKDLRINDEIMMPITCYNNEVMPVVYGMLLGDSSILNDSRCNSNNIRISTTQGEAQLDYLKLKQSIFGKDNFRIHKGKSGYCDNAVYAGHLVMDVNIANHVLQDCYIDGKKVITEQMMDKITPLSLAFWYMDDGTIRHRSVDDRQNPAIEISTCGFTKEENEVLINMLWNKFGVKSNLRKERTYWSIYITAEGTRVFLDLIKDYIPACMKYKTLVEYENLPCLLDNMKFERKEMLIPVRISAVKKYDGRKNYRSLYDIEVADNHNFFANNILTHNCENVMFMLEDKNPYVVTEKIDGTSTTFFLDLTGRKPDFGVCSRNVRQMDADQKNFVSDMSGIGNVYWEMAFKYNVEDALKDIAKKHNHKHVVLQGETYGESVQGNKYKLDERRFAAFNLIFDGERLGSVEAKKILAEYDIPFVPIIDDNYILPDADDFEEFKQSADGKSVINKKCLREGFVYRSKDGQKSFKNVSRKFLLKAGE